MTDQPTTDVSATALPEEIEAFRRFQEERAAAALAQPNPYIEDEAPADDVEPLYPDTMNGKPRFLVVEANLHVQLSTGYEVLLKLDPPAKVFREVMNGQGAGGDAAEDVDQLFQMLALLGADDVVEKLEDLGILETMGITLRFFDEFQKKAQALMGEASRSSRS